MEIIEYALPSVEEDQPEARPAIAESPKDDVSVVTPDDAATSFIIKKSGAPAGKRRRVDDRLNVVPLGPLPAQRPLGPSAHEVWFGRPET